MTVCIYSTTTSLLARCLIKAYQVLRLVHKMEYSPHLLPPIFWNYFTLSTSDPSYDTRHNQLYLSQVNSKF